MRFELTPLTFLRQQRFHTTRQKLLSASPKHTTVTHIAYANGFYHLGRFSANYRQLFGNLPSKTLARHHRYSGARLTPFLAR